MIEPAVSECGVGGLQYWLCFLCAASNSQTIFSTLRRLQLNQQWHCQKQQSWRATRGKLATNMGYDPYGRGLRVWGRCLMHARINFQPSQLTMGFDFSLDFVALLGDESGSSVATALEEPLSMMQILSPSS